MRFDSGFTGLGAANYKKAAGTFLKASTEYKSQELTIPFPEGLLRRVRLHKKDPSHPATTADLIISEKNLNDPEYNIVEYQSIDLVNDRLDSIEELYFDTDKTKLLYIFVKVNTGSSTDLFFRLDIEGTK